MNKFNILLTDNAVKHLNKVMKDGESLHVGLKVSGCNGYSYIFNLKPRNEENEINIKGISLNIDPKYRDKLEFCIIDYKKDGFNNKLVVDNPHVKNQCGCGESVSF